MEIKRATAKGELVITVKAGAMVATLNGEVQGRALDKLPSAQKGPLGMVTHRIGACAVYAHEVDAIEAACAPFRAREGITSRIELGAFPGSRAAIDSAKAEVELAAFDAARPEVLEALSAAHNEGKVPLNVWA